MSASDASGAAHSATNASGTPSLLTATAAETLLATLPLGVLALAADGTVAVLNPAAEALWGVPAAAVLGHTPAHVQPAVLPPELVQALAEAAPAAGPYWLPHTRQWITLRTAPAAEASRWVYWDNVTASQLPPHAVLTSEPAAPDRPEHQRAQAAPHPAEEQYRMLFEAMAQGFCIVEVLFDETQQPVDYRFLVTNPAFEHETDLGDVVGQTMRTLRPRHEARWFEVYGHIARTGEPQRFAHVAEQLGRFYAVYAFRIGHPAEHQVAILFSDISGVRRTEQALREAEESYRTLFNSIDEGYLLCDVLVDEQAVPVDLLYLEANPAAIRLTGSDYRGKRLRELDPNYESYWFDIFGRVALTGTGERLERYAEPDQKWYDFYVHKVGDAASRRVAVVFQDITARKQQEQALRASEAQQAADLAGMRRLYELQAKLADQTDVQAALRDVLAVACEFTGTDRGCVQLLSSDGERLEMAVWQGYPDDSPFISFFRYEGLETGCEVTRVQRKRLIIEDTVGFEGLDGTAAGAATYADDIRAAQSTPLTSRSQETIGVISTQFRQPHRPSDHALQLLDMLAWTAAEFLARHRAEVARRASEQQFRLMADAVPQIVWLTDPEGRVEFFNQQWTNYTGVPYEPTTATEVSASFVHPDDGAATMAAFTAARATGTTFLVEHRIRSRAGDYRWFLVRAEPYRDADTGEIIRWFGASVDIHDRKQAEVALEKAHERLQLAMNTGRIFSFEMNPATRALELSDNTEVVMGFPLPSHIDSTFELIHPDDLQPTVDLINGAIDSRGSYASDYRLVNPANGEVIWFHSQAAFTRSKTSGEWHFVGIAQNITESKRAEAAVHESEEKYRTLFETMSQGFAVCELLRDDSGRAIDWRFLELNPAWEQQTGLGRAQALHRTIRELLPGLEDWWGEAYGRVVDTGEPARFEYYAGPLDRWYQALVFPQGGQRFAVLYDDITARKKAEEVLQQSAARQAFLLQLGDALRPLTDAAQVQAVAARLLGQHLRANQVHYGETQGDYVVISQGYGNGLPAMTGRFRSVDFGEKLTATHRAGIIQIVSDIETDEANTEAERQVLRQAHIGAYITVPLLKQGQWVATLAVQSLTPRLWTVAEVQVVEDVAERTWAAVERARAEEALRESEDLLQKAFAIDTVGVLFFSVQGRMTAANEAFLRLSGYRREELLAVPASVLTPPEFKDVTAHALQELADWGETAPYEKQLLRPDGSRWWGLCSPTRLQGHGPGAECVEFVLDISERKQAEEQLRVLMATLEQQVAARTQDLRESQELLQLVFDTSFMALSVQEAVRDANGDIQDFRVVFLNQELARELGRSDMVGKHYVQEYPGVKTSGLFDLMRKTVETGEPQQTEYYYPYEGFNRWFSCTFVKLNDGLVATNMDITPRKEAEEKVREQAHFIARVNETLPDLLTVTELPSGQVLYVNQDPHEAPGFEREKLLHIPLQGQTDLLRMHPDDAARLPDYFVRAAALADHEIATYGYRAKFDTDHWRWFEVRGSVFQRDPATGAATQLLSVARDVTSQKEAEQQQAKSHQLLQQSEQVASLGSWDYDRTTGEFQWSAGMYQLFGLAPGSPIRPATYLDFVVPDDQLVAERLVRSLLEGRTGFEETLRIQVGDAVKTLRVKAAVVLDGAGEPLRVLGVDLDISEVQRLEADNLRLRLSRQQALFEAVQQAQETERKHIAEGLHNGVGQLLYATKLRLDQLHSPVLNTQPVLAAARNEADRLLGEAIRQTRVLSHELVPTVLAEFGLATAFQAIGQQLSTPQLHLRCQVMLDEDVPPLPTLLQLALYRMAQELGLNIVKHAHGATEASLELETTPGFVLLRAEDNGAGFAANVATSPGLGLRTIRDRVALLNGTLDLGHSAGLGTFVRLRIPLPALSTI